MKTRVVALALSLLFVVPIVAGAAGAPSGRGEIPAAVDQIVARDIIQQAQEQLDIAGFEPGHVDGMFDAQIEAALLAYQANYGLVRTGLLDEATRRALMPGYDQNGGGE